VVLGEDKQDEGDNETMGKVPVRRLALDQRNALSSTLLMRLGCWDSRRLCWRHGFVKLEAAGSGG